MIEHLEYKYQLHHNEKEEKNKEIQKQVIFDDQFDLDISFGMFQTRNITLIFQCH